jgi:hypothetical protein
MLSCRLKMPRFVLFLLTAVLGGPFACEQRFSSQPPPITPEGLGPASSSGALDALLAASTSDAGSVAVDSSHALTVTLCSASPQSCPGAEADASGEGAYRVVFGSGRGAVRSRGQAMADLYKELRDRTASGERLDAELRPSDGGAAPATSGHGSGAKAGADNSDPMAQCAFRLLDLVDGAGEVTLDVFHGSGSRGCRVSLGRALGDSGAGQCLVQEPEQPRRMGR